jgi:hypothetical protein
LNICHNIPFRSGDRQGKKRRWFRQNTTRGNKKGIV